MAPPADSQREIDTRFRKLLAAGDVEGCVELIEGLADEPIDVIPCLRELLAWAVDHPDQYEALHAIRRLAKGGADLAGVTGDLREMLSSSRRATAVLAGSCLTFWLARDDAWAEVEQLSAAKSADARWGVIRALSELLIDGPNEVQRCVDALCVGLVDADPRVRKQAVEGLQGMTTGTVPAPSESVLRRVIESLNGEVAELIYAVITNRADLAATISTLVRLYAPRRARQEHARLLQLCDDAVLGRLDGACPICTQLGDLEIAAEENGLPPAVRRLVPPTGTHRQCPRCGNRYEVDYDEEGGFDFFAPTGEWVVRRLPRHWGDRSPEELARELAHPAAQRQKEAAQALTGLYLKEGEMRALTSLLTHQHGAVRTACADLLTQRATQEDDLTPLVGALTVALRDNEEHVRLSASMLLSRHAVRRGHTAELGELLRRSDRMVRWGALRIVDDAIEAGSVEPSLIVEELRQCLWHDDQLVRQAGLRAYKSALAKTRNHAILVDELIVMLASGSDEVALAAAEELDSLAITRRMPPETYEEDWPPPSHRRYRDDRLFAERFADAVRPIGDALQTRPGLTVQLLDALEEFQKSGGDIGPARAGLAAAAAGAGESRHCSLAQRLLDAID